MWVAVSWAIVCGTLLILGFICNQRIEQYLQNKRAKEDAQERANEVNLLERQNKATIDAQNIDGLAALRREELAQKTAEAKANQQVASAMLDERIAAEKQVLDAQTAARIELAKEGVLPPQGTPEVEALLARYDSYVEGGGGHTLSTWLGNISIENGRVSY